MTQDPLGGGGSADDLRAVLAAYLTVMAASGITWVRGRKLFAERNIKRRT